MKFGKWIGGGLGWAFGGPIGAIIGFAIGSFIDNISVSENTRQVRTITQEGDFIASLLVLTAAVMKADGKVLKSELDYVKRTFFNQFPEEKAREYLLLLRDILKQEIPLNDVCRQISVFMDYSAKLQLLHYLFGISTADNEPHTTEIHIIEEISRKIGITNADYLSIKAMFIKTTDSYYKILEIEPTATDEEVKKAYRRMALKYHPDKVSHLGPEMQKIANEKFQKVNAAYEEIKKQRGMV